MAQTAELNLYNELATYENLVHAISGMTGGVTAISVFYPLNAIRMRLQTDSDIESGSMVYVTKQIIEKHGVGALFQGWWSSVVALGTSNFVYFYVYNAFKVIYQVKVLGSRKKSIDPVTNLLIGVAAGIINVFATTPFWVANTRLTVQSSGGKGGHGHGGAESKSGAREEPYAGVLDCLARIAKEEGVPSLWKGVGSGIMLCSNPAIQFATYERLRRVLEAHAASTGEKITSLQFFVIGAIAKAVATVVTYPLQIAQSRLRNSRADDKDTSFSSVFRTTFKIIGDIAQKDGFLALFKGMEAKLWQTVLTAAFQFTVMERVVALVTNILMPGAAAKKGH